MNNVRNKIYTLSKPHKDLKAGQRVKLVDIKFEKNKLYAFVQTGTDKEKIPFNKIKTLSDLESELLYTKDYKSRTITKLNNKVFFKLNSRIGNTVYQDYFNL